MFLQMLSSLVIAFLLGALGSPHCIGMCGGFVSAFTCSQNAKNQPWLLTINAGRLSSYTVLGILSGSIGLSFTQTAGYHAIIFLRYLSAIFIILLGFYIAGWWDLLANFEKVGKPIWHFVGKYSRYLLPIQHAYQALFLGVIWGFLPCGLIYSALFYAMTTGSLVKGGLIMFCFGLGTLPAILIFSKLLQINLSFLQSRTARIISGLTLIMFGGLSIFILNAHSALLWRFGLCSP